MHALALSPPCPRVRYITERGGFMDSDPARTPYPDVSPVQQYNDVRRPLMKPLDAVQLMCVNAVRGLRLSSKYPAGSVAVATRRRGWSRGRYICCGEIEADASRIETK